jgi:hypothetical protein
MAEVTPETYPSSVEVTELAATLPEPSEARALDAVRSELVIVEAAPVIAACAPRLVLAPAASEAPVPPSATAKSVMPEIEPPVIETEAEFWVAMVPRPNEDRAVESV